jgi:hypothetical protein
MKKGFSYYSRAIRAQVKRDESQVFTQKPMVMPKLLAGSVDHIRARESVYRRLHGGFYYSVIRQTGLDPDRWKYMREVNKEEEEDFDDEEEEDSSPECLRALDLAGYKLS